uniref:Uncharacterized protein n=1 Tax=Lepeophtheirus salmonis TaxID=72036 RepID=A0A0K2UET0_LEPSM
MHSLNDFLTMAPVNDKSSSFLNLMGRLLLPLRHTSSNS